MSTGRRLKNSSQEKSLLSTSFNFKTKHLFHVKYNAYRMKFKKQRGKRKLVLSGQSTHLLTNRMNSYDDSGVCMCHAHTLVGGYQFRGYNLEDGGSMHPWYVFNHLPDHKVPYCLRTQNETSCCKIPQILKESITLIQTNRNQSNIIL